MQFPLKKIEVKEKQKHWCKGCTKECAVISALDTRSNTHSCFTLNHTLYKESTHKGTRTNTTHCTSALDRGHWGATERANNHCVSHESKRGSFVSLCLGHGRMLCPRVSNTPKSTLFTNIVATSPPEEIQSSAFQKHICKMNTINSFFFRLTKKPTQFCLNTWQNVLTVSSVLFLRGSATYS